MCLLSSSRAANDARVLVGVRERVGLILTSCGYSRVLATIIFAPTELSVAERKHLTYLPAVGYEGD